MHGSALDILGRVNIEGRTLVEPLRLAIRSFLKLCIQAGWKDWMVPKFHCMDGSFTKAFSQIRATSDLLGH